MLNEENNQKYGWIKKTSLIKITIQPNIIIGY